MENRCPHDSIAFVIRNANLETPITTLLMAITTHLRTTSNRFTCSGDPLSPALTTYLAAMDGQTHIQRNRLLRFALRNVFSDDMSGYIHLSLDPNQTVFMATHNTQEKQKQRVTIVINPVHTDAYQWQKLRYEPPTDPYLRAAIDVWCQAGTSVWMVPTQKRSSLLVRRELSR